MSTCYHFNLDIPDPDVIFHDGYYYLITTTMHFLPGAEIIRSRDLKNWEHFSYVFDKLEGTKAQRLEGDEYIYGKGMWAPSLRFYDGVFYVVFSSNDLKKTFLYRSDDLKGPWKRNEIKGFYHDSSLLFDDEKAYIVYGNKDIYLTELNKELTGPKKDGLHRLIVSDEGNPNLGYEGSHIYKIDGRYYLFLIHSLRDRWRRVEAMFSSDSLESEFIGGDIFNEDLGIKDAGIAQGGVVTGPVGNHLIMFQDSGAIGRCPVIVPFEWKGGKPSFDSNMTVEECSFTGLFGSDDFKEGCKSFWQFNHEPDLNLVSFKDGFNLTTDRLSKNIFHAKNTLTQKAMGPKCVAEVTIDGRHLNNGDYAGLSAFQGDYAFIGIKKETDKLYAVMLSNESKGGIWELEDQEGKQEGKERLYDNNIRVRVELDFNIDTATCFYEKKGEYNKLGTPHKLTFRLDHFTGARFALSMFSTLNHGGSATFKDFKYLTYNL